MKKNVKLDRKKKYLIRLLGQFGAGQHSCEDFDRHNDVTDRTAEQMNFKWPHG